MLVPWFNKILIYDFEKIPRSDQIIIQEDVLSGCHEPRLDPDDLVLTYNNAAERSGGVPIRR